MKTLVPTAMQAFPIYRPAYAYAGNYIDQPYDLPDADEPREDGDDFDETLEPDDFTLDEDDEQWEVFVPEEDEVDLEPDPRDFGGGLSDEREDDD